MALFAVLLFLIDSSLQLMNVTHLARLVNSLEKKNNVGLKKLQKKEKKLTWKVLWVRFGVYYRIHLNLKS